MLSAFALLLGCSSLAFGIGFSTDLDDGVTAGLAFFLTMTPLRLFLTSFFGGGCLGFELDSGGGTGDVLEEGLFNALVLAATALKRSSATRTIMKKNNGPHSLKFLSSSPSISRR